MKIHSSPSRFSPSLLVLIVTVFVFLLGHVQNAWAGPKRIGFFSGTFDPPHQGHREIILRAMRDLKLDMMIVTAGIEQKHKPGATKNQIREAMARAAFGDIPGVIFLNEQQSLVHAQRGIDGLIKEISANYSDSQIYQVMGHDSLERLLKIPNLELPSNIIVAVSRRGVEAELPKFLGNTPVVEFTPDDKSNSSSKYREAFARGEVPKDIPDSVLRLIWQYNLYGVNLTHGSCIEHFLKAM